MLDLLIINGLVVTQNQKRNKTSQYRNKRWYNYIFGK